MTRQQLRKRKENVEASLSEGLDDLRQCSVFGRYSEKEMIAQLKWLALDPLGPQFGRDSIQPLCDQILMLRKVMVLKDIQIPCKKRNLQQCIEEKLKDSSGVVVPDQIKRKKPKKDGSENSLLDDEVKPNNIVDPKESVNVSDAPGLESLTPNEASPLESNHAVRYLKLNRPKKRHLEPPQRRRKAIPVGADFQAHVPEWNTPVNMSIIITAYSSDSDNSRWLGTQIWPNETSSMKSSERTIGKGRPDSCCCVSPGSVDCNRRHILEERLLLQCDTGPAFFSWKFDEMGEQVSRSWMLKDRHVLESCNDKNFLNYAFKYFPDKYRKRIISYYFNVYIPRRMSLQTRSLPVEQVVTDDEEDEEEEEEGIKFVGLQKTSEGTPIIDNSKDAKAPVSVLAS